MRVVFILFSIFVISNAWGDTARIATWNLGGFHQIPDNKLTMIIKGLKELDADIVALSEVNPRSHARKIARALSRADDTCYKSSAPDQPRARQQIAFLYKCDVDTSGAGLIMGSDLEKRGYRNAAVIKAKVNNFDLVMVGLHLKAGRGTSNNELRSEQLKYIRAYVQGVLMGGEKDVLVLGDYNMIPDEDVNNFDTLNAHNDMRYISSEELSDEFSHIGRNGGGNLLDGFAFTNVDTSEYKEGTLEVVQLHEELDLTLLEFKSRVTDHLPLMAEFNTSVDYD